MIAPTVHDNTELSQTVNEYQKLISVVPIVYRLDVSSLTVNHSEKIQVRINDAWDDQIEQDVLAGRLDALIARAKSEFRAGRSLPILPDEE